jgi:hypothetical protein
LLLLAVVPVDMVMAEEVVLVDTGQDLYQYHQVLIQSLLVVGEDQEIHTILWEQMGPHHH